MKERKPARRSGRAGQATVEFALASAAILFPLTFALVFTAQLLWIWHSVNEFTRQGASYAATHCWQSSAGNVLGFMRSNVPPMINQNQFQNNQVQIAVSYFGLDAASGQLAPFQCDTECSTSCIPDTVTVSVSGFSYSPFGAARSLPAIPIPNFQTSLPIESAGCDPEQGVCLP
jgi:hypothetical protein